MSADFLITNKKTMGDEGGYANNPADQGGETYKGIARKSWGAWPGWHAIDAYKEHVSAQPVYGTAAYSLWVKQMDRTLAANKVLQQSVVSFYQVNFWNANHLGEVNDQGVATWLYNHIVNGGGRGVKWIQAAAGVTVDGSVGEKTIAAINAANPAALLDKAMDNAVAYRLAKVKADPSQKQFLNSWLARDGVPEAKIRQMIANV
jgi:lysozyme family protein